MHVPGDPEVPQDRVSGAHPKDAARLEAEKRDWTRALGPSPVSWLLRTSGKARQDHHPPGPEREGPWGNEASPGHMRPRFQGQQWRCSSSGPGWPLFLCPPPVTKSRVQLKPRSGSSLCGGPGLRPGQDSSTVTPTWSPRKGSAMPTPHALRDFSTSEGAWLLCLWTGSPDGQTSCSQRWDPGGGDREGLSPSSWSAGPGGRGRENEVHTLSEFVGNQAAVMPYVYLIVCLL